MKNRRDEKNQKDYQEKHLLGSLDEQPEDHRKPMLKSGKQVGTPVEPDVDNEPAVSDDNPRPEDSLQKFGATGVLIEPPEKKAG